MYWPGPLNTPTEILEPAPHKLKHMEHQTLTGKCRRREPSWMPQRYLKYRGINKLWTFGGTLRGVRLQEVL